MPLLLKNHIANAFESLRSNRLRTGLTISGVTIGIASIIVILSLSAGAGKIITDQVSQLGGSIAVIRPSASDHDTQVNNLTATLAGAQITSSLTEKDVDDIRHIDHVSVVAPLMLLGGSVSTDTNKPKNTALLATTPDLIATSNLSMGEGQFIDAVTNEDAAVVGAQLSVDLFGTEESVGHTFKTHGHHFTVVGILSRQNNPINFSNVDFDHAAIINLESGKLFNQGFAAIQQINIRADSAAKLPDVVRQANEKISANHQGEHDFIVLSGDQLSHPSNELFSTVAATLTAVAAISLVVGGIGIMNIMLVGVTERTREIGVRKAIGASSGHITWQFLIESLAMSLAGGVLGYIAGYGIAYLIARSFLTFDPEFNWMIVEAAFGVSLVVGLVFGLYPAIRAARKDPIEALRQYH